MHLSPGMLLSSSRPFSRVTDRSFKVAIGVPERRDRTVADGLLDADGRLPLPTRRPSANTDPCPS